MRTIIKGLHRRVLRPFLADQRGATAIEYGLLVAVIAIGVVIAIQGTTGDRLKATFEAIATGIDTETATPDTQE